MKITPLILIFLLLTCRGFGIEAEMRMLLPEETGKIAQIEQPNNGEIINSGSIDSRGFSKVRLFLTFDRVERSGYDPFTEEVKSKIVITVVHIMPDGESPYEVISLLPVSPGSISGYREIPIIGDKMRVIIRSEKCPVGLFKINGSLYFVP